MKCLLYPFTAVPPIAEATESYAANYTFEKEPRHTPLVRSSTDKWILMDFVPGLTLEEWFSSREGPDDVRPAVDLERVRIVGTNLFDALAELKKTGVQHLDLTPSNVIVVEDEDEDEDEDRDEDAPRSGIARMVLVDLGRNHRYGGGLGRSTGAESVYVAPEVRRMPATESADATERADVFSVGLILIRALRRHRPADAEVPDVVYEDAAPLARFIDDCIDPRPEFRLMLVDPPRERPARSESIYRSLSSTLDRGVEVLKSAQRLKPNDEQFLRSVIDLYRGRRPRHHLQRWKDRDRSPHATGFRVHSGWLLAWSVLCAIGWYLITVVVVVWALRDWGVEKFPLAIDAGNKLRGTNGFPGLDSLRADGYELGLTDRNLQALVLAVTFGLVATKYYQSIYGNLTTRGIGGWQARVSEALMRMNSVWVVGPVLVAILVDPQLWPWCAATGYLGVAANDFFAYGSLPAPSTGGSPTTSQTPAATPSRRWCTSERRSSRSVSGGG